MGFIVEGGVVKTEVDKLIANQQLPVPMFQCNVRALLGITCYYCKFTDNYASMAALLTGLTRNSPLQNVFWTEKCVQA